jgi:hypothetical protein
MTTAESKLLLVIATVIVTGSLLCRQRVRHNLAVFALGCAFGLVAQLPIGRGLNQYTPNITLYVSYVSLAVVGAWGCGLTAVYMAHLWLRTRLGLRSYLAAYAIVGIPVLVALEIVGSNLIGMKLHDYQDYVSLLPPLGAMNAPAWLYPYYCVGGLLFYAFLRVFGLHAEDRAPTLVTETVGAQGLGVLTKTTAGSTAPRPLILE